MKKILTVVAAALMVFALTACSNNGGNKVIVKTSAGNVTKTDFYNEMKALAGKQVLQEMVYEKILDKKYDVSKKLKKTINNMKSQYGNQFKSYLQSQGFPNEDEFKKYVKFQLLLQKAETAGVKISDKAIKTYYNKNKKNQFRQIKVSHILVKDQSTAKTLEKKLKNGASFASLAKQHSIDKASGKKGGNLGFIPVNTQNYDATFMAAAKKLKVGQVSNPVHTQFGWHIIKVTDEKTTPLSKVKSQIKQQLTAQKAKSPQEVFNELNKNSKIDVKVKEFKDLFKVKKPKKQQSGQSTNSKSQNSSNKSSSKNNSSKSSGSNK